MKKPDVSLLDEVLVKTGCSYLSDLTSPVTHKKIISAINTISAEDFPLAEWQDAYSYILQSDKDFSDAKSLRSSLLDSLHSEK
ncbi:MAG: hypothetical protein RR576_05285 [Oscillospiraceae bacterium]